jgi:hypothetical protein
LEVEQTARREAQGRAGGKDLRIRSGRVRGQQPCGEAGVALWTIAQHALDLRRLTVFAIWLNRRRDARAIGRRLVVDEDVMHERAITWTRLDRLEPLGFREIRGDVEVLVLDRARAGTP